jgi:S1-C subfamily serine protease
VAAGVVIRADGIVLTAYHPVKNAHEVQVRLRDGEVYDQVDLIDFDEHRDVAGAG